MRITRSGAAVALGTFGVATILGACTHTPSKSSTSTTRVSTTTTSTTTAPSTSTTSTVATCQPAQLHIAASGSNGAAGTIELTISLTNTSSSTCMLFGYPGMQLLDTTGGNLTTNVVRGGGLAFENVAPTEVSLGAGQIAYFNIGYSDVTQGTAVCSQSSQVEITPPNDTAFAVVQVPEINACGGGTLHVSPVFASTDSAATSTTAPASS